MSEKGLERNEHEFQITEEEYNSLLKNCKGKIIKKRRYKKELPEKLLGEIDIFKGELEGLAYLEIEFESTYSARSFPDPQWVERDVTYDHAFKNSSLAAKGMPEGALTNL